MKTPMIVLTTFLLFPLGPLAALTVTLDDNYPPYSLRDERGTLQGISVDLWNLWAQKTGEPVLVEGRPWSDALLAMEEGRADVLDTVFYTPERAARWAFGPIYAEIQTAVYHRDGLAGLLKPADLKGYLIGVKAGDASADALRKQGDMAFREYPDYVSLVAAAGRGEVLVFCMDVPAARHFLLLQHLEQQFHQAFVLSQDGFRRAVLRDKGQLLARLEQGFSQISPAENAVIDRRWKGDSVADNLGPGALALLVLGVLALLGALIGLVVWRTRQLSGTEERLKLSEDRARALIEALPDLLFVIDRDGVVKEALGPTRPGRYGDPRQFLGQPAGAVFGPEVAAETKRKMQALTPENGVATLEATLEVEGELRTFEGRIVRLNDQRFLSIVRDVSATRRAWLDDLHRNKLESLALLAGGLAHDFNNSLAVIQGFVSLAQVQLSTPDLALISLDKAVRATRRAAGLTSQLRVLAQSGEVHRTVLSLKELVEESATFALVGSPCLLEVEADVGDWFVEADPDQLSQVFHNLALNAVQAMPQGGTLTLVFRRLAGDQLSVSVVDEGDGIAEENLSKIFDPYFTTKPKGTGLGLAVVQAVVQRHGGTLEVDSRVGQGTVFTVSLPSASAPPPSPDSSTEPAHEGLEGCRVLVMEDEPDVRMLITEVCLALGLSVVACRSGTEALRAYDEALSEGNSFDLLISDILVPGGMGGRELLSQLRARPGRLRALAVTGFTADRSEGFDDQGFDVTLGKPFTIDELKTRIVELLKSPWKAEPKS